MQYKVMKIDPVKNTKALLITYTLIFCLLTAGVFCVFIWLHKSFIQYGDSYKQGYFWVVELKNGFESLFAGNGYPRWSWYKGTGMETSFPTDPFDIIAAMFPAGHIELGYTLATVLRLYVSGLAFIAFAKEAKLDNFRCLLGGICYAFCGWCIDVAFVQAQFLINTILFPLLIRETERIYKGRSPVLFMLLIMYYMMRTVYFAYMAAIGIILYVIIRYPAYSEKFRFAEFAGRIGTFILYGLIGITASAVCSATLIKNLMSASTESASDDSTVLLYNIYHYLEFGGNLTGEAITYDYTQLGFPLLCMMLLAVAVRYMNRKKTAVIMSLIFMGFNISPVFGSAFNGFGYPTSRWWFMLIFFVVWTAVEQLDMELLREKKNILIMGAVVAALAVWTIGFDAAGLIEMTGTAKVCAGLNLLSGAVLLAVITAGSRDKIKAEYRQTAVIIVTCLTLVCVWTFGTHGHTSNFLRDGQVNEQLETVTPQRAASTIGEKGFYRFDSIDGLNKHNERKTPANENQWWKIGTLYVYDSEVPSAQLEFNRLVGNDQGYYKRVCICSNDNRMGLDYLYGVRYFLGNDSKAGRSDRNEFAGYGFKWTCNIDGVDVLENKYETGLGYVFDRCISESDFRKAGKLSREQLLLQAAVIPDDAVDTVPDGMLTDAASLDTEIQNIDYSIKNTDGAEISGNTIEITKDGGGFTIRPDEVKDAQLFVCFDKLIKNSVKKKEGLDFEATVSTDKLSKTLGYAYKNQTVNDIEGYRYNMGSYDSYDGEIRISFAEKGKYTFENLNIAAMSVKKFDKYASALSENVYRVSEFDDREVTGAVDTAKGGILFLSVPKYENWDIYVDGEKAERIDNVDIAFMGAYIPQGHHNVTLKYNFGMITKGLYISVAGLLMIIAAGTVHCRRRKKLRKRLTDNA